MERKELSKLALSLSLLASTPLRDRVGNEQVVSFMCLRMSLDFWDSI